jgi:hypothetical protein
MENNQSTQLIKNTKRLRVGGIDPGRKELLPFLRIGTMPDELLDALLIISRTLDGNDLGSDSYQISQHCDLDQVFNINNTTNSYRQVLLQSKMSENSDIDECAYTEWNPIIDARIKQTLADMFGTVYRFRISVMQGNHELNWHIDTDTSVLCRAQICLADTDSSFEFKTKTGIHILNMERGGIYFINTGWLHRVVNNGTTPRTVAIFGFKFHTMRNDLQSLIRI